MAFYLVCLTLVLLSRAFLAVGVTARSVEVTWAISAITSASTPATTSHSVASYAGFFVTISVMRSLF